MTIKCNFRVIPGSGICTLISAPPWGLCMNPRPPASTVGQLQWFWKKKKQTNKRPTNTRGGGMSTLGIDWASYIMKNIFHVIPWFDGFAFLSKLKLFFPGKSPLLYQPCYKQIVSSQPHNERKLVSPRPSPGFIGFWRSLSFDFPSQAFWMKRQKTAVSETHLLA